MQYTSTWIERRRHVRVEARGPVVLRGHDREIHGRAVAASQTMLEVRCQLGFTLLAMAGASVEIEMRLDDAVGGWFLVHGQVARVHAADHSLVIALRAVPEPLARLLAAGSLPPPDQPTDGVVARESV